MTQPGPRKHYSFLYGGAMHNSFMIYNILPYSAAKCTVLRGNLKLLTFCEIFFFYFPLLVDAITTPFSQNTYFSIDGYSKVAVYCDKVNYFASNIPHKSYIHYIII